MGLFKKLGEVGTAVGDVLGGSATPGGLWDRAAQKSVQNRANNPARQPSVARPTITNGLSAVNDAPYGKDEWGWPISQAKFEGDARARDMVAASKQAAAESTVRLNKIEAYKNTPEYKADVARREGDTQGRIDRRNEIASMSRMYD